MITREMLKFRTGKTSLTLKYRSPSRTVISEKSLARNDNQNSISNFETEDFSRDVKEFVSGGDKMLVVN
jgi:hypothetical protein